MKLINVGAFLKLRPFHRPPSHRHLFVGAFLQVRPPTHPHPRSKTSLRAQRSNLIEYCLEFGFWYLEFNLKEVE
jgi:hypothetical protein